MFAVCWQLQLFCKVGFCAVGFVCLANVLQCVVGCQIFRLECLVACMGTEFYFRVAYNSNIDECFYSVSASHKKISLSIMSSLSHFSESLFEIKTFVKPAFENVLYSK